MRWAAPALAAALAGARLSPAPTARLSGEMHAQLHSAMEQLLSTGAWRSDTLYLLAAPLPAGRTVDAVVRTLPPGLRHLRLDGHDVVVSETCLVQS
jgi:hypothetical protein